MIRRRPWSAAALAVLLATAGWLTGSGAPRAWADSGVDPAGAAKVVRAYIAALNRHDPAAVCALLAPALRAYEVADHPPLHGPHTCVGAVRPGFSRYYSRHQWASARITGGLSTAIEPRTGFASVAFSLVNTYVCGTTGTGACHPGTITSREIVSLIGHGNGWQILKPGPVLDSLNMPTPGGYGESEYYPPGTPATIAGPVSLTAPPVDCPAGGAHTDRGLPKLISPVAPSPPPGVHPDLTIKRLTVSRLPGGGVCATLMLAAPPRPDDEYALSINQEAPPPVLYTVDIDGLGRPHPLIFGAGAIGHPRVRLALPQVYGSGDQVMFVGHDPAALVGRRLYASASSQSIQDNEPLLRHPLEAEDLIPVPGCLLVPSGKIFLRRGCGDEPAG